MAKFALLNKDRFQKDMQLFHRILNPKAFERFIMFLHGINTNTSELVTDFQSIADEYPDVQIILVQAPKKEVFVYRPVEVTAWYKFGVDETILYEERESLDDSKEKILELIDQLQIPKERLILSGFSQGGAMALYTVLTHAEKFLGVVGMCTYLCYNLFLQANYKQNAVLICSKNDDVFSFELIKFLVSFYNRFHGTVIFMKMDGTHEVNYTILKNIYMHFFKTDSVTNGRHNNPIRA